MNWNGNEKGEMRTMALEHSGKAVKVAIMFPSYSKKCLKEGLQNGKFNKDTFIIAVEKEAKYIKTIYKGCFRKPLPLWEGMNETLNQPKADEISQVL